MRLVTWAALIIEIAAFTAVSDTALARPWPDTSAGIYVFNDQLSNSMTPALTQFSATHYAGCQKMARADADSLRAYNANSPILHYRLGLALGYRAPDAHGDPTGPYLDIINGD